MRLAVVRYTTPPRAATISTTGIMPNIHLIAFM